MNNIELLTKFGDPVERRFGNEICSKFPRYADLWANFIGNNGNSHPLGYGISHLEDKNSIEIFYRNLYQSHYTIFFHLVGMHETIKCYNEMKADASIDKEYLYYLLRNCEVMFYLHLGIVMDMSEILCRIIFECKGFKFEKINKILKGRLKEDKELLEKLKRINKNDKAIRIYSQHHSVTPITIKNGELWRKRFKIYEGNNKYKSWEDYHGSEDNEVNLGEEMEACLSNLEETLNKLHKYLIEDLEFYYKEHNIRARTMLEFVKIQHEGTKDIIYSGTSENKIPSFQPSGAITKYNNGSGSS